MASAVRALLLRKNGMNDKGLNLLKDSGDGLLAGIVSCMPTVITPAAAT